MHFTLKMEAARSSKILVSYCNTNKSFENMAKFKYVETTITSKLHSKRN
jgi:hypothetical protein